MAYTIETIYRAVIYVETTGEGEVDDPYPHGSAWDRIEGKAFEIAEDAGATCESFSGCPAAGPYFVLESNVMGCLIKAADTLVAAIKADPGLELK